MKYHLQKSFHRLLLTSSVSCHAVVIGDIRDIVRDVGNEPPLPTSLACLPSPYFTPYWRQVIPSPISVAAWVQGSYINGFLHFSFKPSGFCMLSRFQCSPIPRNAQVVLGEYVLQPLRWVELGLRFSLNHDFRDLSISPTYVISHSSHFILYTGPTTLSLLTGSLGFTNNCRSVFIGLKYVGMLYLPTLDIWDD